jgi:hypothetical protein
MATAGGAWRWVPPPRATCILHMLATTGNSGDVRLNPDHEGIIAMSSYPIEPHNGLYPTQVSRRQLKRLERMDELALGTQHRDALRIDRAEQAAAHGLIAVAQISSLEASLVRVAPHAEGRLRAVADAGTIGIVGLVARSGF